MSWATNEIFDARAAVKRGPFSLDWIRGVDAAADFFSRDVVDARSGRAGGKNLPLGAAWAGGAGRNLPLEQARIATPTAWLRMQGVQYDRNQRGVDDIDITHRLCKDWHNSCYNSGICQKRSNKSKSYET